MLKKSFVSLVFSESKIQILKLNSSKKKVEKFLTVDVPDGLIRNHKVQDTEVLSKLISQVWKKAKIREKTVGLVVPEFSTFIKLLEMPVLDTDELDEAISWQAHDYLPKSSDSMTMDWRIAKKGKNGTQVLLVAMEKEVLNGYVEAVGRAGLFPTLVEPPSISLVRASNDDLPNKLIIYSYFNEVVVTIADREKIIVSSVIGSNEPNEIINTINSILGHYKDIKIENVLVGGLGIDQKLVDSLSKGLGQEVKVLNIKVKGMSNEEIQSYMIPLSLQFKPPSEPADENTINLLPKNIIKKYRKKHESVRIWSLMMIVTFVIWSSFLAAAGVYVYFIQQISSYQVQTSANRNVISETKKARETIGEINKTASGILKIEEQTLDPQVVLNSIARAKPEEISINTYKLELDRYEAELKGFAAGRADLIEFKENLEGTELFGRASIPISSFEVEENLEFDMLITINKDSKEKL